MSTTASADIVHEPTFLNGDEFHIPRLELLRQDGTLHPQAAPPELERETALRIYRAMLFTRVLDERMLAAQRQGRLSFYMQSTGEEGTVVGSTAALDPGDMIMAQYREQGALAYRGFGLDEFMDQLFGNEHDHGKGRQMPIHYGSKTLNYLTISSPLATQIPQATGYAYGQKLAGDGHCTLTVFGEGAASEGDFHAALNMASVLQVPVIFLCRNNGYAISTPAHEQFHADGIAPRAFGYRMKVIRVDGNDILAVYQATQEARKLAVEHNQPVLIEAMTYRLAAHSSSDDPSGYRSRKEEEAWRDKDPVLRMKLWLEGQGWWSEDEEKQEQETRRREVLEAMKRAEKRPPPPLDSLVSDVYQELTPALAEQLEALKAHIRKYPEAYPKSAPALDTERGDARDA
ncbi:thiamine pyrophosphate-dependent dehydrogenase E1 component subunit alpha [Modicisalibacter tunisiensis]|uniref:2-oxoisovalerate dehydrogenase subunit alpha n=1 Tax=Modicisalibacter tunisiensis TaxID=390637 RepID=A0ABS7X379_9GAMM|nr:thiamine pyrophosphate-dependent dehydrogenase E1 component subunit alpha [Modicisalibacter tunisiensis]MBZ9537712.1 thiamine pyrophosphate-dependent dehydrogenase E1 component subunit alpha [Modicisalibacter tunisiensis]MBZ9568869.1 thiamine pyrophosphate-dependent dehydrogenase E1 component subunit alpha [Modicisalibacter tunisiensis]